jgi:transposase
MHLSDNDLRQLDEARLEGLPSEVLRALSKRLLSDLKEARERLNQSPENSSRPPSSRAPWERGGQSPALGVEDEGSSAGRATDTVEESSPEPERSKEEAGARRDSRAGEEAAAAAAKRPRRPGRRPGHPGVSRRQVLPIDQEQSHAPSHCACCGEALEGLEAVAYTGRYELELERRESGNAGVVVTQTKHTYFEVRCGCGHCTRAEPGRALAESDWTVELTEWHLVGPRLSSVIVALSLRLGGSHRRIQEFLFEWFGLSLSTALISQCRHELGRALEPVVEEALRAALSEAELVHVDETGWPQHDQALWLWAFVTANTVLYVIGRRTRELLHSILGPAPSQWIMSDGYSVYRAYGQRLRCWAHILRKARGLAESLHTPTQAFGRELLSTFETLMQAVYAARAAPGHLGLRQTHSQTLQALWHRCVRVAGGPYPDKAQALARELLNDWDSFWVVLEHPHLPLTNNEAERALRPWVILRRVSQGTRTEQGSRAFCALASVIDTCRKRGLSPWPYLTDALRRRRQGLPAPALPLAA